MSQEFQEVLSGLDVVAFLPRTKLSKSDRVPSTLVLPFEVSIIPNKLGLLLLGLPGSFEEESDCNFFICCCSTFEERDLIRSMKPPNCWTLRRGPRLKFHSVGMISSAMNSVSAIWPTCRNTFRAAIITAGSFVLMAFSRGTSLSWTVYLSRIDAEPDLDCWGLLDIPTKSPPEVEGSSFMDPPHKITNDSKPRTLIARLLVLVKTEAIGGKMSSFTVEKSRIGNITGRHRIEASTREWVPDSSPKRTRGSTSGEFPLVDLANVNQRTSIYKPFLKSRPEHVLAISSIFSRTTMRLASLLWSRSCVEVFAPAGRRTDLR